MNITKQDAANLLKLIDRALTNSPHPGGLKDHLATDALVKKLVAIAKHEEAAPSGEQDSNTASQ